MKVYEVKYSNGRTWICYTNIIDLRANNDLNIFDVVQRNKSESAYISYEWKIYDEFSDNSKSWEIIINFHNYHYYSRQKRSFFFFNSFQPNNYLCIINE